MTAIGSRSKELWKDPQFRSKMKKAHENRKSQHGFAKRGPKYRFYTVWSSINRRCNAPNATAYKNYGGRGIKVEWKRFEDFRDDMYESYLQHVEEYGEKDTTIDRINNDGNYSKENCRWADRFQQNANTRMTIEFNGECAAQASRRLGGSLALVKDRLQIGWSKEDAFTKPPKHTITRSLNGKFTKSPREGAEGK